MDNKHNFITLIHHFIFSPKDYLLIKYSSDKNYRHSWFVFLAVLSLFLGFYLAIFPTLSTLINNSFRVNGIDYTTDMNTLIMIITLVLGIIQFTSMVLVSFFIIHIIGILIGGAATAKEFFPGFIYSIIPIGIKFTILIIFSFFLGSDFAFSVIYPNSQQPLGIILNIIIDPFFWWSTILGCIALKIIHQISYKKTIIIISITMSLGIISLFSTSLFL
ncbi:YIP1 family protein [Bacillus atrophaeus]|uniref:YIP1 family protein n=1 Tax=Bacillus atrophaeus TaxID=1452 RepID=UPI000D05845F|nr:YIP1 family protein [Bacillus atrophaeus]MED1125607.1 YIP1 family protein [Bacillus atrophaeus]PSA91673.1 hypothetical protein C6371_06240 [Bacillus atrophaeus]